MHTIRFCSVVFGVTSSLAVTHTIYRDISDCGQYIANILPTNDDAFYKYQVVQVIVLFCTAAAECPVTVGLLVDWSVAST